MAVYLSGRNTVPAHAVEIAGGPKPVTDALIASLTSTFGYRAAETSETGRPVIHLIVDALNEAPQDVALAYLRRAVGANPRPIPLFLTARPERFRIRGQAWEREFLFPSGTLRLGDLVARLRMLAYMWGDQFPIDIIRDAVVGSFRMELQLDEADNHQRSELVDDLQRVAGWDGSGESPRLRVAPDDVWPLPLENDHPYVRLFANTYRQIAQDIQTMLMMKNRTWESNYSSDTRDVANTILRKIPRATGRFSHMLRGTRSHVLILDDEAPAIAAALKTHRVGFEPDSASLEEIFEFVAEQISLNGDPPYRPFFDPEEWIRKRTTGAIRPGNVLADLRCADLILLDLSLNQGQESELAGFILLEKLRTAVPDLPLVIHTGSAKLEHIIHAIRNGADWYVRKDGARTYSDLASILSDISKRSEWSKRARRLEQERSIANEKELPPPMQRDEFRYIWRSLSTELPEGALRVLPFTDGASGALTCGIHVIPPGAQNNRAPIYPSASFVAKIDRPHIMLSERERFRRLVRPWIGNRAGRIDSEVVYAGPDLAGIAYAFSGIHQGPRDGSRTSLEPLSTFLSRETDAPSFMRIAPVFDELLNDLLRTLHRTAPEGPRHQWMEPLFAETATLRDSHELRLPPLIDVELTEFSNPVSDIKTTRLSDVPDQEIFLPMCRVQRMGGRGFTVIFTNPQTGLLHRANLVGDIAQFLSQFRRIRPNRALSVRGRVVRKRSAFYERLRPEYAGDLEWFSVNRYADVFDNVNPILSVFQTIEREKIGIIHGDLNLNNILLDVDDSGAPIRGALWLIDFAHTRRDSLAHDFVELEVDLITRILAPVSGRSPIASIMKFHHSLDAGPLYGRDQFDAQTLFVSEACQFIRRVAAASGIAKSEYVASLAMYYLLNLKIHHQSMETEPSTGPAVAMGRWALAGATAALATLIKEEALQLEGDTTLSTARNTLTGSKTTVPFSVTEPSITSVSG